MCQPGLILMAATSVAESPARSSAGVSPARAITGWVNSLISVNSASANDAGWSELLHPEDKRLQRASTAIQLRCFLSLFTVHPQPVKSRQNSQEIDSITILLNLPAGSKIVIPAFPVIYSPLVVAGTEMKSLNHLTRPGKARIYTKRLLWSLLSLVPRETTLSTHNGLLTFHSRDRVLGKVLFSTGNYEWDLIVTVMDVLRDRGVPRRSLMMDVGANIGMISIACVRHGLYEKAVAFEPDTYNFSLLNRNVSQNRLLSRIECQNIALSSQNGIMQMELSTDNFGDHRLRPSDDSAPGYYHEEKRATHPVRTMRLDDFVRAHPSLRESIGLIWVDIQGHEGHFLSGAGETIRQGIPVVMEFWPYAMIRAGTSEEQFVELARGLFTGYFNITSSGRPEFAPIETLLELFGRFSHPREMGTVLFV